MPGKTVRYALITVALLTSLVWLTSQFIQPILPYNFNAGLVLFFVVLGAVLGTLATFKDTIELFQLLFKRSKQAELHLVDISEISEEAQRLGEVFVQHKGRLFPVVDFKLMNSGTDLAFLKRLSLVVDKAEIDVAPVIIGRLGVDDKGNLVIELCNCGWGTAQNVIFRPLRGSIRDYLNTEEYIWHGEICAERGGATVVVPGNVISPDKFDNPQPFEVRAYQKVAGQIEPGDLGQAIGQDWYGEIEYHDERGNLHQDHIDYNEASPLGRTQIWLTRRGFVAVFSRTDASILPSSEKYNVRLETKTTPYELSYTISHTIKPGEAERFQVALASQKSAFYVLRFQMHFNETGVLETRQIPINVWNPTRISVDDDRYVSHQPYRTSGSMEE